MKNLRTIDQLSDIDLAGKTVIVRADLDVPTKDGEVTSSYRVQRAAITIRELSEMKARVVVLAHKGRPEGDYKDDMSLMSVRFELGKYLDMHVKFAHLKNCRNSIIFMEDSEVLLLENMRFNEGETADDVGQREEMVKELVELSDYYVNDAFASYRPHASTYELAKQYDTPMAGRQVEKEIKMLSNLKEEPKHPYVAVVGGAKLNTKIEILENLVKKADILLIGGAMAYTLLKAKGIDVGSSKIQEDMLDKANDILQTAKDADCEIFLPVDHIAGEEFSQEAEAVEVDTQQIPENFIGMDIGERTLATYLEKIKGAETIMWNGPMGVYEWDQFSRGTEAIGEYIALTAPEDAYKVAGGGDTIAAMEQLRINFKNFDHVSTGGGAMLEYLAEAELPCLKLLKAD